MGQLSHGLQKCAQGRGRLGAFPPQDADARLGRGRGEGLLAVPRERAAAILEWARKKHAAEENQMAEILAGRLDRSWNDRVLTEKGGTFIDWVSAEFGQVMGPLRHAAGDP